MSDLKQRTANLSPAKRALLEQRLQQKLHPSPCQHGIPLRPQPDEIALSFGQERLWFLEQLDPGSGVYHRPVNLRFAGPFDGKVLQRCLDELIQRHEVLRTAIFSHEGSPTPLLVPSCSFPLRTSDLTTLAPLDGRRKVARLALEEIRRPFDLSQAPLVRGHLLKLSPEEHILLITFQHIVFDGWSQDVWLKELTELYKSFLKGMPSPLSELPRQFADYAQWQQERYRAGEFEEDLAYWRQQLRDAPQLLELPSDRPRVAKPSLSGAEFSANFSRQLADSLTELSRLEGTTLFMMLLAAFQTLLFRQSGQEDIVVGTPIAGRSRPELEGLIGVFINTLALRTKFAGDPTFRKLLAHVRQVALDAYAHQDLPFEKLVEALQPQRNLSHCPLFQVLFQLRNLPQSDVTVAPLRIEVFPSVATSAALDLSVGVTDTPSGLSLTINYSTDLFEKSTVARLLDQYEVLLQGIVDDPDRIISKLPILTERQRHQLLYEWNDTSVEYLREKSVPKLFEQQVELTPDNVAVACEGAHLSYRELNDRSNQLAHHLQKAGVGNDSLVGVCLPRSPEVIVAIMAILKSGAAYLALDMFQPKQRTDHMIRAAELSVIITLDALLPRVADAHVKTLCLDARRKQIAAEAATNPQGAWDAENLAYAVFTSGSTGQPKGILIPHRALTNHSLAAVENFEISASDHRLQLAPLSSDVLIADLFPCLLTGGSVVVRPSLNAFSIPDLLQCLEEEKITVVGMPSALWHEWVLLLDQTDLPFPSSLRVVIVGMDRVRPELLEIWKIKVGQRAHWFNAYGPSETTCTATIYEAEFSTNEPPASVPIGRPIANTKLYVLDAHLYPVPIGVPGEIYIGGSGVARGYLHNTALTAERFIPDPLADNPSGRVYRTGDLGRYRADGNVEFLGRTDHQVKVRGHRVELGEIEAVLSGHPAVNSCVVALREDRPDDKRLVAYVVPSDRQSPVPSNLRRFVAEKLPDYMVPAAFVALDRLPQNPNGKVDRSALPCPDAQSFDQDVQFVLPRTSTEEALAAIWSEVLGVEQVGVHDNFFALGGHSLRATQVTARIANRFDIELPVSAVFEYPTLGEMASRVVELQEQSSWSPGFSRPVD